MFGHQGWMMLSCVRYLWGKLDQRCDSQWHPQLKWPSGGGIQDPEESGEGTWHDQEVGTLEFSTNTCVGIFPTTISLLFDECQWNPGYTSQASPTFKFEAVDCRVTHCAFTHHIATEERGTGPCTNLLVPRVFSIFPRVPAWLTAALVQILHSSSLCTSIEYFSLAESFNFLPFY